MNGCIKGFLYGLALTWAITMGGCASSGYSPTMELTMFDVCYNAVNGWYEPTCGDVDNIYIEYHDRFVDRTWYYDMTQYAIDGDKIPLPCTDHNAPMNIRIYCGGSSGVFK